MLDINMVNEIYFVFDTSFDRYIKREEMFD